MTHESTTAVQEIIDRENDKLCSIDPDALSEDARAICKALSAVAGTLAAVALAVGERQE